jgi:hypothetical protein
MLSCPRAGFSTQPTKLFDKATLLDNLICRRNSPSCIQLSGDACVQ